MKKNILNLEGVTVLTKEQQKMVNGGERCTPVGNHDFDWYIEPATSGSPAIVYCEWECRKTFLGIGVGQTYIKKAGCQGDPY